MPPTPSPIDVRALIASLADYAIEDQLSEYEFRNRAALNCIANQSDERDSRLTIIQSFLDEYKVLMGFNHEERRKISSAVLEWADRQDLSQPLTTPEEIVSAHAQVAVKCAEVRQARGFTSLASKVLWLCYPDSVPIYDKLASTSLHILAKFEPDIPAFPFDSKKPYANFVYCWKYFFERYADALDPFLAEGNPKATLHKTKVFDAVLWKFAEPKYVL